MNPWYQCKTFYKLSFQATLPHLSIYLYNYCIFLFVCHIIIFILWLSLLPNQICLCLFNWQRTPTSLTPNDLWTNPDLGVIFLDLDQSGRSNLDQITNGKSSMLLAIQINKNNILLDIWIVDHLYKHYSNNSSFQQGLILSNGEPTRINLDFWLLTTECPRKNYISGFLGKTGQSFSILFLNSKISCIYKPKKIAF